MSKSWPLVPLGELLVQDREYVTTLEPREYPKLSVKLYGKGVTLDSPADASQLKMQRHQFAKAGQVILSEIWGRKGAIGFVPSEGQGALCTSHFFLFDLLREKVDPGWLSAIFRANYLAEQLGASAFGTTGYAAVRPKDLLACQIPLPPLSEQRRIVARVEELAAKIEEARQLWLRSQADLAAYLTSLHLALSNGRSVLVQDFLRLEEHREPVVFGRQYPQVGVKGFGGGLFAKEAVDATETTYKCFNRLYQGALILSQVKGWEGAIAVCPEDLAGRYASPEYRTFRCVDGAAIPEYLASLVVSPWFLGFLRTLTRGVEARRERIRPEMFLNLRVPMPAIERQKQAIKTLENLQQISILPRPDPVRTRRPAAVDPGQGVQGGTLGTP